MARLADVVYAEPTNPPTTRLRPELWRPGRRSDCCGPRPTTSTPPNSRVTGWCWARSAGSVAAYAGAGVYLDVALAWVAGRSPPARSYCAARAVGRRDIRCARCPRTSGGWCSPAAPGRCGWSACWACLRRRRLPAGALFLRGQVRLEPEQPGGLAVADGALLVVSGAILFSLGVIAEYIGVAVNMAMGKPLYLIVSDPGDGPLGRAARRWPTTPALEPARERSAGPRRSAGVRPSRRSG